MTRTITIVALTLALGQTSGQRFRSGVDVVTVDALVTRDGRALSGLTAADFELRDNGVVQEIDSVSVDDAPVSMLLALDTSNSVEGPTLNHLKRAAIGAIDALTPADRAAVLTFADTVTQRSDWSAPTAAARSAIEETDAGGATCLYDAGYAALTLEDTVPGRRSYVLLFSDGGDTSSWLPARAFIERARRSGAVVSVVTRRAPRPDVRLEYRSGVDPWTARPPDQSTGPIVSEVAGITGGHVFVVQRAEDLRTTFADIVSQFRNRYLLRYRPRGVDGGGWHTIGLQLKRGSASITARRGYAK
jgi:Ca-activated chloride channel homolog